MRKVLICIPIVFFLSRESAWRWKTPVRWRALMRSGTLYPVQPFARPQDLPRASGQQLLQQLCKLLGSRRRCCNGPMLGSVFSDCELTSGSFWRSDVRGRMEHWEWMTVTPSGRTEKTTRERGWGSNFRLQQHFFWTDGLQFIETF